MSSILNSSAGTNSQDESAFLGLSKIELSLNTIEEVSGSAGSTKKLAVEVDALLEQLKGCSENIALRSQDLQEWFDSLQMRVLLLSSKISGDSYIKSGSSSTFRNSFDPHIDHKHSDEEDTTDIGVIIADINQYTDRQAGQQAGICTACSAAFLQSYLDGNQINQETIKKSLEEGRKIYEKTNKSLHNQNLNLNAKEVLEHGLDMLQESGKPVCQRPSSAEDQIQHYMGNIIAPLKTRNCAIFTKAPYSFAVIHRPEHEDYVFFDSHGEADTQNRAFIRIFKNAQDFCKYFAEKVGFTDFDDVDFDLETGQDNPNLYELTFVEKPSTGINPQKISVNTNEQAPRESSCLRTAASVVCNIVKTIYHHPGVLVTAAITFGAVWLASSRLT